MKKIICSFSGIRGIIDKGLNPSFAYKTARLFYDLYLSKKAGRSKPSVVIGKDPKDSGIPLVKGLLAGLKKTRIHYLGVTSTPAVEWAVSRYKATGGIVVTASHNPAEWNGIKLISEGRINPPALLPPAEMGKIINKLNSCSGPGSEILNKSIETSGLPPVKKYVKSYCEDILRKISGIIDECSGKKGYGKAVISGIKEKNFKIVLDACCGSGIFLPMSVLLSLGIKKENIFVINKGKIENCDRPLEPVVENLSGLLGAVKKFNADAGFAVDPDQDRLVVLPLSSEENTPIVAAKFLLELQKESGTKAIKSIVTNYSASRAWEDIAGEFGIKIIRVRVGEANVAAEMIKRGIIFGAEGNGGVIFGNVNYGRNSAVGMALIISYLAASGKTLEQIDSGLPQFYMSKQKISIAGKKPGEILGKLIKYYRKNSSVSGIETYDGCKILFKDDSWVNVRPSNTEPIIRIFAEVRAAKQSRGSGGAGSRRTSEKKAQDIIDAVKKIMADAPPEAGKRDSPQKRGQSRVKWGK